MTGAMILIGCPLAVLGVGTGLDTLIAWAIRKWQHRAIVHARIEELRR